MRVFLRPTRSSPLTGHWEDAAALAAARRGRFSGCQGARHGGGGSVHIGGHPTQLLTTDALGAKDKSLLTTNFVVDII